MVKDVFTELPPAYRDYAKNEYQPQAAEDMAVAK